MTRLRSWTLAAVFAVLAIGTVGEAHRVTAPPRISIEAFACNDGDFGPRVNSVNSNAYRGVCVLGGPNCTFQMIRVQ